MRFAAIADIHGNLPALEAVLTDIARRGADFVANLGDLVSGPLWPAETAERLMSLDMLTIRGNCDRQVVTFEPQQMGLSDAYARQELRPEHLAWLARLPPVLRPAEDVLLCHGTPGSDETYFLEDLTPSGPVLAPPATIAARTDTCDAALILCGHTHVPRVVRLDDGRIVVNPGSVGLQAYQDDEPFHHIMQAGSPEARYAILERVGGAWTAELIMVEYDWREAASLAAERGRPDWATALATGRLSG